MEELRFGIKLDDRPARIQEMAGREFTVIGSASFYQEIGVDAEGRLFVLDPTPSTPSPMNSGMDAFRGFLRAFDEFYAGEPTTEDEEPAVPRRKRLRLLKKQLNAVDADAVHKDRFWCVVVEQIEDGIL
ncbi:SUKH-4 family immunity protein [Kineosporia sp. J2-2]|uniref:SUKH-4 family immunity protein n=1 Tax=Kineosporia corallincola TaxID=2835133 RepID=A0ABS5TA58_9ACTN|nr:SUKH-4 family immunity protein [Kineosporia corallincola]MBT0767947.1 SUKH-4 family immunity protein [Kineosporia corallincola]